MSDENILDIAHISFLDMIKVMITLSGAASAKGTLIRNAIKTADRIPETDYPTFEAYLAAIENATNPITVIEGKATHMDNYIFGLKNCPFGPSIKNYTKVFEKLTKSQQAAILQAGEEATAYMRGAWKVAETEDLAKIKGLMKEVITVDKKPFMDAVAPLVGDEAKKLGAESFIKFVLDTGKNFK